MKKLIKIIQGFGNQLKEDNINAYASSCAFFVFLSLAPTVILFLSILPYTPIDFDLILNILEKEMPGETYNLINSVVSEIRDRSIGMLSLAAVTTLWSAGKGVSSLICGFNAIDRNKEQRNFFVLRGISCLYTLAFLASIIILLLFVVYGNVAINIVEGNFPGSKIFFDRLVRFKAPLSFALMVFLFMICYAVLPYKKHRMMAQIPGAIFSALGWIGFSYIFSIYVNNYNPFSMYGSLTTIIILLFWLYTGMYILLIGANLNRYFKPIFKVFGIKNLNSIRKNQKESLEED